MRAMSRPLKVLLTFALCMPVIAQCAGLAVQRLDGTPSTLAAELVKGEVNVVMVWTTYCPVCRSQYPLISTFHAGHRDKDAVVLGIALAQGDERTAVGAYRDTSDQRFPSVVVAPEVMRDAYQHATGGPFTGTPTYLVLDGAGKLRSYIEGPTSAAQLEELVTRFGSGVRR